MKLAAAVAALPAAILADASSEINSFCVNEATDATACEAILGSDSANEAVQFCMDKDANEKITCMSAILNDEDDDGFATGEFAMDEFLNGIGEDPMLQNVLAELNGLQAYLEANGVTRSIGPDGELQSLGSEQLDSASDSAQGLKRFVELKQLVSWMQPKDKRISRYCFYGCWCLPEGAHSFVAGEGRPVDLVDKACQYLWFCYQCAINDFTIVMGSRLKKCSPDKRKYSFRFTYQKNRPKDYDQRNVICKDNYDEPMNTVLEWRSSCSRAICECDRGLALRLYRAWRHWDKSRHRIWSQKVISCKQLDDCNLLPNSTPQEQQEAAACAKRGCLFIVQRRCLECDAAGCGGGTIDHSSKCCGVYEDDGGRTEMRDHGGTHDCCSWAGRVSGDNWSWNGNWYNTITHECKNGVVQTP